MDERVEAMNVWEREGQERRVVIHGGGRKECFDEDQMLGFWCRIGNVQGCWLTGNRNNFRLTGPGGAPVRGRVPASAHTKPT